MDGAFTFLNKRSRFVTPDAFIAKWKDTYDGLLSIRRFELRDVVRSDYYPIKDAAKPVSQAAQ